MEIIWYGFLGSLSAGLATGLGAIPIFFLKHVSPRSLDALLGVSAGIMLGASSFSLIIPALKLSNVWISSLGLLLGGIFLAVANYLIPHIHTLTTKERNSSGGWSRVWLFVLAITIHNLPEGLAVGVGFGTENIMEGTSLAMGIGLQNMPEGLAVAFALLRAGYSPAFSFFNATFTGLVEPIGGLIGVSMVSLVHPLLPWGLAFAAGAMLFVISSEIIPETHRQGHPTEATFGLLLGFILMMIFDNIFG